MTDKVSLFVGIGFLLVGALLFLEEDTTQPTWLLGGALLLGLGVVMVSTGAKNWLHWRREWKAYRSPE